MTRDLTIDEIINDDMFRGYCDGIADNRSELPAQSNYSEAYVHGWRNGRDDRLHTPRATAQQLREEAGRIEREEDSTFGVFRS